MNITIGSRGSHLALWQANWVKDRLAVLGHKVRIQTIKTRGDRLPNVSLAASGAKGLFIKEIEEALAAGQIDLAVHSLKDLPTEQPEGLVLSTVPERSDARDVLISSDNRTFADLPPGARIGTSSLRRQSQLQALRIDLQIVPMRGNLDTRLRKLDRGECNALVLAAAGLERLGLASRITGWFSEDDLCPAVGQGALAIEIRRNDQDIASAVAPLDHPESHQAVRAERALLRSLGGGCQVPIAAHARYRSGQIHLVGVVADVSGAKMLRARAAGQGNNPEALGKRVAAELLEQGARTLLDYLAPGAN